LVEDTVGTNVGRDEGSSWSRRWWVSAMMGKSPPMSR